MAGKGVRKSEKPSQDTFRTSKKLVLQDKSLEVVRITIDGLKEKYDLTLLDILNLLKEKEPSRETRIPVSVFSNDELSALETICKYLKEELKLTYHEIAVLLRRDDRTIWTTYNNAAKKRRKSLPVFETPYTIPISLVADRRLSVLEAVVSHLKDTYGLRYNQIGKLLNRDERNIWTVYARAGKRK